MATDALTVGTGDLPPGVVVMVWGPPGCGKTSLLLSVLGARDCLVDTEGLVAGRLHHAAGDRARRVLVGRPTGFDQSMAAYGKAAALMREGRVERVLVDGLLHHWRYERMAERGALAVALAALHRLRETARATGGRVLVTNQATSGPTGAPRPVGGLGPLHLADVVVRMEPLDPPWVRLALEKHPGRGAGITWDARLMDGLLVA